MARMTDEYRALVEEARDALYELLSATDVALSCTTLREAYRICRETIDDDDSRELPHKAPEPKQVELPWWKSAFPLAEREQQVLHALSDQRLTIGELRDHLYEQFRDEIGGVEDTTLTSVVTRLQRRGDLDREKRPWRRQQTRWHYFRRVRLDGPIADLDRVFHHDDEAER